MDLDGPSFDYGVTASEVHGYQLKQPIGFLARHKPKKSKRKSKERKSMKHEVITEGTKLDTGKARIDLIAPEMLFGLGEILAFGAEKYGERNWEKGMAWGRLFAALMRHLWAWWAGKTPTKENFAFGEFDIETGRSHLWHASCCLMMLVAFECRGHGKDDRFAC